MNQSELRDSALYSIGELTKERDALLAEIRDSDAREADLRDRAEVAEAKLTKIDELAHRWARTSEYITGDTTAEQVVTGSLESAASAIRWVLR